MAAEELRSDPFTWAFARHHHQIRAREQTRTRRRRLLIQAGVGALVAVLISAAAAVGLSSDPEAASVEWLEGGSGVINVDPGAGPDRMMAELRAIVDDAFPNVEVASITGRAQVAGRLLAEGDGFDLLGRTVEHDFTASSVVVEPDAEGALLVVIDTPSAAIQQIPGYQLACDLAGRTFVEASGVAEAHGFTVRVMAGAGLEAASAQAVVNDVLVTGTEAVFVLETQAPVRQC